MGRWSVVVFLFLSISQILPLLASKNVNLVLKSNWDFTPLEMEACEYFSERDDQSFWKFLLQINSFLKENAGVAEKETYEKLVDVAKAQLSAEELSLMLFSLSTRAFSPRIQAQRSLADSEFRARGREREKSECSESFFVVGKSIFCSLDEMKSRVENFRDPSNLDGPTPLLYHFDHLFPGSFDPNSKIADNDTVVIILYSSLSSPLISDFYSFVESFASTTAKFKFVLRFAPPLGEERKVFLQGYGTSLTFKNVEYKAVDDTKKEEKGKEEEKIEEIELNEAEEVEGFNFAKIIKRNPALRSELLLFRDSLLSSKTNEEFHQLQPWDIKDIGVQASQRILLSSNPLRTLRDLSQNFPSFASSLSKLTINSTLKEKITKDQSHVPGLGEGGNLVLINGRVVNTDDLDPFVLLGIVQSELDRFQKFQSLSLSPSSIQKALLLPFSFDTQVPSKYDIRTSSVLWLNNLEQDDMYTGWSDSVFDLMRPTYYGQPYFVAKNLINIVVGINFATDEGLNTLSYLARLIFQQAPIRVGIIPTTKANEPYQQEMGSVIAKIFKISLEKLGSQVALNGFSMYWNQIDSIAKTIQEAGKIVESFGGYGSRLPSIEAIIEKKDLSDWIVSADKFWEEKGFGESKFPIAFVNGAVIEENLMESLVGHIFNQYPSLQALVKKRVIDDESNIYDVLLSQPDVLKRHNPYIFMSRKESFNFKSLIGHKPEGDGNDWNKLTEEEKVWRIYANRVFLSSTNPNVEELVKLSTFLIATDFNTQRGLGFALNAVEFLDTDSPLVRISFLDNGSPSKNDNLIYRSLLAAAHTQIKKKANAFIKELLQSALKASEQLTNEEVIQLAKKNGLSEKFQRELDQKSDLHNQIIEYERRFSQGDLQLLPGQRGILTNGRIIAIGEKFDWEQNDFSLLAKYEEQLVSPIKSFFLESLLFTQEVSLDDLTTEFQSDVAMKILSELYLQASHGIRKQQLPSLIYSFSTSSQSFSLNFIQVQAILNPLSKTTQKMSAILMAMLDNFPVEISVLLNPHISLSSVPLKSFYRYLIMGPSAFEFDRHGKFSTGPSSTLVSLPTSHLLELSVDVPESWLVQSVVSQYDLDNIKLEDLEGKNTLYAEFELEHLIVSGGCADQSNHGYPPQGLQLSLGDSNNPYMVDTIVMNNFGYFQLKSNPGVWQISMAKGKASDIYTFADDSEHHTVVVDSFEGQSTSLPVKKRPGKEAEKLLIDEKEAQVDLEPDNNMWSYVNGLFSDGKKENSTQEKIHIFSIASGHLYERFLKIMMLSVVKNTKSPVKFWFLKNYLSPQFKSLIPHMAAHYGFEVELVTYKWPSWLHRQTEKQRIIWAYKILFLDVLFPLNVKKIIFVDADQVVRADMKDLWDLDLKGAALGYTAFCDSRKEMDGFRFWKQGYWKNHLRGKPYHISALYVVDLRRFRLIAAGDRMRAHYDGLARDPNSLSNLDQDLPNYLQHGIKIFTLPQDWLWCETWCDDKSKTTAKTIDLCNNPMTKTPKLENAVRIIPEWTSLDNEVKALDKMIKEKLN